MNPKQELENLKRRGVVLPRNPFRAQQAATEMHRMARDAGALKRELRTSFRPSEPTRSQVEALEKNTDIAAAMARQRRVAGMRKSGSMSDIQIAIPRFYDPLEYWDLSGLPWNMADEGHRHKLHKWMRLYYATHYLVPILVDIFTRFPLVGMSVEGKDKQLNKFYEDLFLDQLNYEEFLVSLGREYWCGLPGERVQTSDGMKLIEDISIKDEVLTHEGRYRSVLDTSERPYTGDVVTVRPHYGLPFRFTEGHEVLIKRDGESRWLPIEQIRHSDFLFVPVNKEVVDKESISVWETLEHDDWRLVEDDAALVGVGIPEWISWPNSEHQYHNYRKRENASWVSEHGLNVGDIARRNRKAAAFSPLETEFPLDDDLLWLFGLYVAEGCIANGGSGKIASTQPGDYNETRWCLHSEETDIAERIVSICERLFGLTPTIRISPERHSLVVVAYNIPLAHWFVSLFGDNVYQKNFPAWALHLPEDKTIALLDGYLTGDGNHDADRIKGTTASSVLASQLEHLIRRLGFISTIYDVYATKDDVPTHWYDVGPTHAQTTAFANRLGWDATKHHYSDDGAPILAHYDDDGYWVKVFRIETAAYEGPVYNMAVEEDESYVSSVAVHNCVGEAFPLGSFNESLGVWEREELLNPEDIVIENFPLLGTRQMKVMPPEYLTRLAQTKSPPKEYKQLELNFSELLPYLKRKEPFPVSDILLKQVAFKVTEWDDHGTPILLRGLRTLIHEEKLLASQDAIAERLYSPLILAKLGIQDMGGNMGPWIPGPEQLEAFRDDMDLALSSDFRLMVHHFALEVENVFGREQVPDLGGDFDRVERRLMQIFGLNPSLLLSGGNSQPYASSALQAEFMNQILRTYQQYLKRHFRERALIVAEAQGHYEYEKKGQTRVPIMEDVVEEDEDGNKVIVRKHKLLVPTLTMECLAYGSRVMTPDGPVATEALTEGDLVLAWDLNEDKGVYQPLTHSYDNGEKDVYRIITTLGRQLDATAEHPFLTKDGWQEAESLRPGTELRIGTSAPMINVPKIRERDARFLGLLVGDGCVSCCGSGGVPAIANKDQNIIRWTNNFVSGFGCSLKSDDGANWNITQNDQRVNPNPIKQFLYTHGVGVIDQTSHTKRIPADVWSGGSGVGAAFLAGYLDADGTVVPDKLVAWDSCNRELLRDCQDLLALLGIRSSLRKVRPGNFGSEFSHAYRLDVTTKASLALCQYWLDPLCERKQIMSTRVLAVDERRSLSPQQASEIKVLVGTRLNRLSYPNYKDIGKIYGVSSSTVWRAIQGDYDNLIECWVDPNWDEIRSIELIENVPTWSLGVDEDHTHVTEGLVTHNTLDLRDEATERNFLAQLRQMGVPISDEKLMVGISFEFKDSLDEMQEEMIQKTVAQQMAKLQTYKILETQGLPIPPDLRAEVESSGEPGAAPPPPGGGGMPPMPGGGGMPGVDVGAPVPGGGMVMPPPPAGMPMTPPGVGATPGGGPPPIGGNPGSGTVPPASNERRPGLTYNTSVDEKILAAQKILDDIEEKKRQRQNGITEGE